MYLISAYWQHCLRSHGVGIKTDSQTHLDLETIDLSYKVKIKYEDGSYAVFNYANFYEDDTRFLIVTEHCGFHEVRKLGAKIKRTPMFAKNSKQD